MRQRKLLLPPFNGGAGARDAPDDPRGGRARGRPLAGRSDVCDARADADADVRGDLPSRVRRLRARADRAAAQDDAGRGRPRTVDVRARVGAARPRPVQPRRAGSTAACGPTTTLLYEEIERRRREPDLDERTDVLSLLLRARDEDGQPMTDVELRDELMTMLAAGHETTSTGLAWAFDLLLHNRPVLDRLRDELAGGDDAYLDAVVTETLRLRPVIDAAERTLKAPRTVARLGPAGRDPRLSRDRARPPPARPLSAARTSSGPSASSTRARSRTRGCRSAAASGAASAPRSPRPRWPRCCESSLDRVELAAARPEPRARRAEGDHPRAAARDRGAGGRAPDADSHPPGPASAIAA